MVSLLVLAAIRCSSLGLDTAAIRQVHVRLPKALKGEVLFHLEPKFTFDEAIPSWNAEADSKPFKIELRGYVGMQTTKWYSLGAWSASGEKSSEKGQADVNGDVFTDTLRLVRASSAIDVRITGEDTRLKKLDLCLTLGDPAAQDQPTGEIAALDVPTLAQGDYPKGEVICSPTNVAMVLAYWSAKMNRPDWKIDVPAVTDGVWDKAYDGAGNWAFNTAFAGSLPGMSGYVTRMSAVSDIDPFLRAGKPVVCSVAASILEGKPLDPKEKGHLVTVVGFTADGQVIINNPGHRARLRKTYARKDFDAAWRHSKRTVYIICPS